MAPAPENRLLARLPQKEYERLLPMFRSIPMIFKDVLSEARAAIEHVYFPSSGVVSAITGMQGGASIEVATIGKEGMVGVMAFVGAEESPHRQIIQVPGEALRMDVKTFRAETAKDGPFRQVMTLYATAFHYQISQAIACNGLHTIQRRCCRWILMTHDRAGSDEFPLTHEFLSHMLGVRRVSVTDVLKPLQEAGWIRTRRGKVTVLDRKGLQKAACECYQIVNDEFERLLGRI